MPTRSPFGLRNANKRGVVFDPADPADIDRLLALAGEADIVLESLPRALATSTGITPEALLAAHPHLVVVSITDFGRTGPYADYVATDAVLAAMGGVLSRSGLPGRPPLLPPAGSSRRPRPCTPLGRTGRVREAAADRRG